MDGCDQAIPDGLRNTGRIIQIRHVNYDILVNICSGHLVIKYFVGTMEILLIVVLHRNDLPRNHQFLRLHFILIIANLTSNIVVM